MEGLDTTTATALLPAKEQSQNININLDGNSIKILKEVDPIFRDSLINIGLRMVKNTELFNTITDKKVELEDTNDMASLEEPDSEQNVITRKPKSTKQTEAPEPKPKPKSTTWDSF